MIQRFFYYQNGIFSYAIYTRVVQKFDMITKVKQLKLNWAAKAGYEGLCVGAS